MFSSPISKPKISKLCDNYSMTPAPTPTNMMRSLLDNIEQCHLNVANDQKAYEQRRRELGVVNKKLQELTELKIELHKRILEVETKYAEKASDYSHVEIREKVVSECLEKLQNDVKNDRDHLRDLSLSVISVSNRYLNECKDFGMMYNSTELGAQNRKKFNEKEMEDLRLEKHKLEYALEQFLKMVAKVEESGQENKDLERQFRIQEETDRNRENEAYKKLSDIEESLDHLHKQQEEMEKEVQEEINRIQTRLKKIQESISYWERRVSENHRIVDGQNRSFMSIDSATSPMTYSSNNTSNSSRTQIRLGNGNTVNVNNKVPRLSQYVKPTPQFLKTNNQPNNSYSAHTASPGKIITTTPKVIQTRLQFSNPSRPSLVHPKNVSFAPTLSTSSRGSQKNSPIVRSNANVIMSIPASQRFATPYKPKSGQISDSYPPSKNCTSSSSDEGKKTFSFKKKSIEGPEIPGPTCRSTTVTLGSTPFSTFQNSRSILKPQDVNKSSNQYQNSYQQYQNGHPQDENADFDPSDFDCSWSKL